MRAGWRPAPGRWTRGRGKWDKAGGGGCHRITLAAVWMAQGPGLRWEDSGPGVGGSGQAGRGGRRTQGPGWVRKLTAGLRGAPDRFQTPQAGRASVLGEAEGSEGSQSRQANHHIRRGKRDGTGGQGGHALWLRGASVSYLSPIQQRAPEVQADNDSGRVQGTRQAPRAGRPQLPSARPGPGASARLCPGSWAAFQGGCSGP